MSVLSHVNGAGRIPMIRVAIEQLLVGEPKRRAFEIAAPRPAVARNTSGTGGWRR